MKILMSAFACGPDQGSEEGVGWNWAVEAARLGHDVLVLTQTRDRQAIEEKISARDLPPTLRFEFVMPRWLDWLRLKGLATGYEGTTLQLVHLVWQFNARRHVARLVETENFDIIHHITYGGIRHPTRLGGLGVPLVLGPLGGGDRAPYALRKSYNWAGWIKDLLRDLHTWSLRFDPITRAACRHAGVIFCKTQATLEAVPRPYRRKAAVRMEIGTHDISRPQRQRRDSGRPLQLMYAGRFIFLKGMAMGLRALAEARNNGFDVRLTMVGSGPDEAEWRALAEDLHIADALSWRGWVPHAKIGALYRSHDALLFPSLRDSSGNVVLEALVNGMPVICLGLGGPGELVNADCGRVVPVGGLAEEQCVTALGGAITELAGSADLCNALSLGAHARGRAFHWPKRVAGLYADVEARLGRQSAPLMGRGVAPAASESGTNNAVH